MINIKGFFKQNNQKMFTLEVWFWAAVYRFCICFLPMKWMQRFWGERGVESENSATQEEYRYAKKIGMQVNRTAGNTPWKSLCLVRALTARKMLKKRNVHNTLYLGVGMENEKMVAHAWLRVGTLFVTGGNGEGYAVVDKYRM